MVPTIFDIDIGISVKSLSDWQWLLRFRNILQIHVTSCSDRLWRWFWAQITLEFHGGFGYHTGISKFQLNNPENVEKCSRTNREIEILLFREDTGVVDQNGWHHSIPHEILHKKYFSWFFRNFLSDMNCRELEPDFVVPAGFQAHHWIRHEILHKICASGDRISKWEASDPQDRFCFFLLKKNKSCTNYNLAL